MTHSDVGHYAAKHPQGTEPDAAIRAKIEQEARQGALTCAAAHAIAEALAVPPAQVGRCMDLLEIRLTKCQLGLFGYTPHKKIVAAADKVTPDLETAIQSAVSEGRLSCESAWQVAKEQGIKRMALSEACEALNLKVKPCQLGAF